MEVDVFCITTLPPPPPLPRSFHTASDVVCVAIHTVEWNLSGDWGPETATVEPVSGDNCGQIRRVGYRLHAAQTSGKTNGASFRRRFIEKDRLRQVVAKAGSRYITTSEWRSGERGGGRSCGHLLPCVGRGMESGGRGKEDYSVHHPPEYRQN